MRIFIGYRIDDALEKNKWILKYNFSSRNEYSIDKAILEKRLLYNTSMFTRSNTVYTITNLEAYYDRQLANIGSILIELIRVDY